MKNPKVSIIIPVHNGKKTLRKCLDSLLNQTYKNYEGIIIDNNSNDETKEIIQSYAKKDKKIIYQFEPKKSVGKARNCGLSVAKGDIILVTDSDCIIPNNWIEEMTRPIIFDNENVVQGSAFEIFNNRWTRMIQDANENFFRLNSYNGYIKTIDGRNFAIKGELIKNIKFDPEMRMIEDFELFMRLDKITKILFLKDIKVGHYNKMNIKKIIRTNFIRGFWVSKINKKYNKDKTINNHAMFSSFKIFNILILPFCTLTKFLNEPLDYAFFNLISLTSWEFGILWERIRNILV